MTQFGLRFSYHRDDLRIFWYTKEFMVNSMTAGCPDPVAAKQVSEVGVLLKCYFANLNHDAIILGRE